MTKLHIFIFLWLCSPFLIAQETCSVLRVDANKEEYELSLNGENKKLFSETVVSALAQDHRESLDANEALIKRCSSSIADNDELLREYQQALDKIRQLSAELLQLSTAHKTLNERFATSLVEHASLIEDYDALVKRYRRSALRGKATFNPKLGVGINNSDLSENWDVFLGVEVFQFDAWLYGNSDRQGIGLGLSF